MGCANSKSSKTRDQKADDKQQQKEARARNYAKKYGAFTHGAVTDDFIKQSNTVVKGTVRMFSGCQDDQTSADVFDVASFGLPAVDENQTAGGACTNALLSTLRAHPRISYAKLLVQMQKTLKERKYTQVPQLSSSHPVNLKREEFDITLPQEGGGVGRTKALLIGINYTGQKGELKGCVNDAKMMREFLIEQGYSTDDDRMRVLTDDDEFHGTPTAANIFRQLKWLMEDCQPGDSLFLHYSGHGGQMKDQNGEEADGYDETLIPSDYATAGQIRDDVIYKMTVACLPEGAQLVAIFDCCHSGTILDLPFAFAADSDNCDLLEDEKEDTQMNANGKFNFDAVHSIMHQLSTGKRASFKEIAATATKLPASLN